jgi:outer membrane protein assembly factor BamB
MKDRIYLGIKGQVLCLEKDTGREIWRTPVRRGVLVNVVVDGDFVLVYSNGHLFSLDSESGRILWENKLPGLGHGYAIIATRNSQTAIAAAQQIQAHQAAAVAASSSG